MKKKIISFLVLAVIILPCMLLLSACGKGDAIGYKVCINGKAFVSEINSGVTAEYGKDINFSVYKIFENGEQEIMGESEYELKDDSSVLSSVCTVGTYTVKLSHSKFGKIAVDITIVPQVVDLPVIEDVDYTGEDITVYPVGYNENVMTVTGNTGKVANSYETTIDLKDKTNYVWADGTTEIKTIEWNIKKVLVEKPTLTSDSLVYNYDVQDAPVSEFSESLITMTGDTSATVVKADGYEIKLSLIDKVNSAWADGTTEDITYTWYITKLMIDRPEVETATYTYNGDPQVFQFKENSFDEKTMNVLNRERTNAGNSKVIVSLKDADNTAWDNGTTTNIEFDWTIAKKEIARPEIANNFVYDGQSHTVAFTGFEASDMVKTDASIESATNAGVYKVYFKLIDAANNKWVDSDEEEIEVTWEIEKKPLEIVTLPTSSFTYTGDELDIEDKLVGFNLIAMEIVSGDKGTDAGDYTLVIKLKDSSNYIWNDGSTTNVEIPWVITKKELVKPILTVAATAHQYNKDIQKVDYRGYDEKTMEIVSGDTGKNAGDYILIIKLKDTANYAWKGGSIENVELPWSIAKIKADAPATEHKTLSGIYDPAKTLADYSNQLEVGYKWEDETICPKVLNDNYYALYNPDPQNYFDRKVILTLNILKAEITAVTFVDQAYTYNKNDQSLVINGFDENLMTKSGDVAKNAGSYTAKISLKDKYNYIWSTGDSEAITYNWTINKCRIDFESVRLPYDSEFYYNGQNQTPELIGFDSDLMIKSGQTSGKEPGFDYTITISLKDKTNYVWWESFGFGQGRELTEDRYIYWYIQRGQQSEARLKTDISKKYDGQPITKNPEFVGLKENPNIENLEYYAYNYDGSLGDRIENLSDIWHVGKYCLRAAFEQTAHYDYSYVDIDFYIYHDFTINEISFSETIYSYYGEPVEPEPYLYIYQEDNVGNIYGSVKTFDWLTVAYENNDGMAKRGKIILTGDGKVLRGTVELGFDIVPPAELVTGWYFEGGYYSMSTGMRAKHNVDSKNPYLVEFTPVDTYGELKGKFMYTVYSNTENVMIQGRDIETVKDGVYSFELPSDFYHVELYYYEGGYVAGQNVGLYNSDVSYRDAYEGHDFNYVVVTKYQDEQVVDCDSVTFDLNNPLTISKSNCDLKIDIEENIEVRYGNSLVQITYNGNVIEDIDDVTGYYGMIRRYKLEDLEVGTYVLRFSLYVGYYEWYEFTIIITE